MQEAENKVFAKCAWRLIPFMGLLYVANFLDRVNVSFAALTMNRDIGLSAQAYGIGAGVFFLGYFLFEVPSNVVLERVGARLWMFRIMLSWGVVSMAMAFAHDAATFAFMRFLLGLCEAGFFPGMILYLTYWFPASTRGQFNALFLSAILVANIFGAPLSGFILAETGGLGGLHSWQWLFLIEGLPSCALAFAVLIFLPDKPAKAAWLSAEEKRVIAGALARDAQPRGSLRDGFGDWRVWTLAVADIGIITSLYGIGLWLPQIVKGMGFGDLETGFVVGASSFVTLLAMIAFARHSDRVRARIPHIVIAALFAAVALIVSALLGANLWSVITLTAASIGIYAALAIFWTLPQSFRGGTAAAGAIALVNAVGNLGGFFGPTIMGYLKDATGNYSAAMVLLAGGLVMTIAIVLAIGPRLPIATAASPAE